MVLRRSTTDCAWATALSSAPRSMLNFMPSLLHAAGEATLADFRLRAQAVFSTRCGASRPTAPVRSGLQRAAQQLQILGDLAVLASQLLDPLAPRA